MLQLGVAGWGVREGGGSDFHRDLVTSIGNGRQTKLMHAT